MLRNLNCISFIHSISFYKTQQGKKRAHDTWLALQMVWYGDVLFGCDKLKTSIIM